jgi:hypothetical protein
MNLGTYPKQAMSWIRKNNFIANQMTSKARRGYARYAAMGAGLGAIRGAADNIVGEDRVSILGGAIQGAVYGAAFRGGKSLWKYGRGRAATGPTSVAPFRGTRPPGVV